MSSNHRFAVTWLSKDPMPAHRMIFYDTQKEADDYYAWLVLNHFREPKLYSTLLLRG
jgi:hypothetical protein